MLEPAIGPNERLSATIALSSILFGIMILGIGFTREDAAPVTPTLDVILTQTATIETPKHADFIAQANNQGGGDRNFAQRPRENQTALVPKPQIGITPQPILAEAPSPTTDSNQPLLTTITRNNYTTTSSKERINDDPTPLPIGPQLMRQRLEMARLAAEIDRQQALYAKRPKRKFISASTQQYEYAAYMRAWVEKVERVGNLNYPEQARRQGLTGRLVMTVAVRRNGSVEEVTLVQPSQEKLLDEAAIETVRLAEPFPALPKTEENIDVLHITRTWDFKNGLGVQGH